MSRTDVVAMSPFLLDMVEHVVILPEYVDLVRLVIFLSSSLETLTLGALCCVMQDKL